MSTRASGPCAVLRGVLLALLPLPTLASPPPIASLGPEQASAEALAARALAAVAAREPDVEVLQRAAAQVVDRSTYDLRGYPARSRWAALVPHLTAEYRHEESANRVYGQQTSGEVDYLRLAPSNTMMVRATWDLGALAASTGELSAASHLAARAQRRAEAVEKVTRLFFERRKLRVALLVAPPVDPVARAQAEVEIARLGAELDALTGGKLREVAP